MSTRRRIVKKRLKRCFPNLKSSNFRVTSRRSPVYNCIAWAAGDNTRWWQWNRPYFWPNAARIPSTAAAIELFLHQGFQRCGMSEELEVGWEKVAIYENGAGYTHAAKQLESGMWSSKLGKGEDIEHKFLSALAGEYYGQVAQVMKRKKN